MKTIWILALEPIDTRYTRQWHEHLPKAIAKHTGHQVIQLDGEQVAPKPSPGAFLDFAATNIWKSTQLAVFMKRIQSGKVSKGDYVLITDAWNPAILQIKYTSDLLGLDLKIGAIWHAGSYDPNDFLGRACGGVDWAQDTERALFNAIDDNFFATEEHIKLFGKTYEDLIKPDHPIGERSEKVVRTGFPFEYFEALFEPFRNFEKRDLILFPHRIAPEKQVEIFRTLAERMPEYEWVVCQEQELTKDEYHTLLGQSKIVFSANLQETYGISMVESLMANSFPMMPDRLTYSEMYDSAFLYPSEWTDANLPVNYDSLEEAVKNVMNSWNAEPKHMTEMISLHREKLNKNYMKADIMYDTIMKRVNGE